MIKYKYSRKELACELYKFGGLNGFADNILAKEPQEKKEKEVTPPTPPVSEDKTVEGKVPEKLNWYHKSDPLDLESLIEDLQVKLDEIIDYLNNSK
jgi:hypothetical protein